MCDLGTATRYFVEAAKLGTGDSTILSDLDFTGQKKPEFLTSMDLQVWGCS